MVIAAQGFTLTESRSAHLDHWLKSRADRCEFGWNHEHQDCPECDTDEWAIFVAALRSPVRDDGSIHQCDVRPKLRGRLEPKHIGLAWKRARRERLVVEAGFERSDDVTGRNGHRMEAHYTWRGVAASDRSAAA